MKAAVITCSNRSARGERPDDSGRLLAEMLRSAGHEVLSRDIVPDDVAAIQEAVRRAIAAGARAVLTTGGTGLTPTDVTPEAIRLLLSREVPGIAEALRQVSREKVPTSVLSRGVAGTIGNVLVVTLPGSPGGVRDGMAVLAPLLEHAVDQIGGGDHAPGGGHHVHDHHDQETVVHRIAAEPSVDHEDLAARLGPVAVSDQPLDVEAHERAVDRPGAGAHVVFCGVVRSEDDGRTVVELEYEGYPAAEDVLKEIAAKYAAEPDVQALAVSHRVGHLKIGDVAIVAAVATAHRREAFEICARLVDEVKHRLPIWKRQVFDDGTDELVNFP